MRHMWICNPATAPSYVKTMLDQIGVKYVTRIMVTKSRQCWAFITDADEANFSASAGWPADPSTGLLWTITACNKQYVSRVDDLKYLGCLGNVSHREAEVWVRRDDENWYLTDIKENQFWIPMLRNPNRRIPTGDVGDRLWPKQKRNWPLSAASYEEWRDEIVNKMIKVLDEAL